MNLKRKNTLELKYQELLERHTRYLENTIDHTEELLYYKKLCEDQKKEIKELKKGVAKNER